MSFANVNEYNDMLRAQDRARACHRQQPQGLANYQAKKAAQEAARLAPFAIVKETYGNYPWHVWKDGQELGCQGWFETKKAAVAWIEEQKKEQERPETISNEQERPETISNEQERTEGGNENVYLGGTENHGKPV